MPDETITVSKKLFDQLQKDSAFLGCLKAAGVDNWDSYSLAWEMYREEYGNE
jgi:hypothetical protein